MENNELNRELENECPGADAPVATAEAPAEAVAAPAEDVVAPAEDVAAPVEVAPAPEAAPIEKPKKKKKGVAIGLIIGGVAVGGVALVAIIAGIVLAIWLLGADARAVKQADALILDSKYTEAYDVLAEVKPEKAEDSIEALREAICEDIYAEIEDSDFEKATALYNDYSYMLDEERADDVNDDLLEGISDYIFGIMAKGDYIKALEEIEKYPDHPAYTEICTNIRFETFILTSILDARPKFKNPSSIQISSVEIYKPSADEPYPVLIMDVSGQNGFGGYSTSYIVFDADDLTYLGGTSTLDSDDADSVSELLTIALIRIYRENEAIDASYDLNRVNRILSENITPKLDASRHAMFGESDV